MAMMYKTYCAIDALCCYLYFAHMCICTYYLEVVTVFDDSAEVCNQSAVCHFITLSMWSPPPVFLNATFTMPVQTKIYTLVKCFCGVYDYSLFKKDHVFWDQITLAYLKPIKSPFTYAWKLHQISNHNHRAHIFIFTVHNRNSI